MSENSVLSSLCPVLLYMVVSAGISTREIANLNHWWIVCICVCLGGRYSCMRETEREWRRQTHTQGHMKGDLESSINRCVPLLELSGFNPARWWIKTEKKNVGSIAWLLNSSSLSYIFLPHLQEFRESTISPPSSLEQVHTNTGTHVHTCTLEPRFLQQCKCSFLSS